MPFHTAEDGHVYNDDKKHSGSHHGSVRPTTGLKLTTKPSTEKVGTLSVLPKYRSYIRERYPEMIEKVKDSYWMAKSSELDRLGKYDKEDEWNLTSTRVQKLSPSGAIGFDRAYMTEHYPELYKLFLQIQEKGLASTKEEREEFLKKYVESEVEKSNERFKEYGMKEKAFLRKSGDKYELVDTIAPEQLFLDDVEHGKIKDENGFKLSFNQVQGKSPNSGSLNEVHMHLIPSEGGYTKKQLMNNKLGNYVGEVVSIDDLDKSLPYKSWEVITKIIDDYHYQVGDRNGHQMIIRDTDIRSAIGDIENEFTGIGKDRHKEEIVPIIKKNMEVLNQ